MSSKSSAFGQWRSRGYGWALHISPAGYALHDETQASVALAEQGDAAAFAEAFEIVSVQTDALALRCRGDITTYWFDRAGPAPSRRVLAAPDLDAAWNLEILWRTMRENYAFFDLRGHDWDRLYETARAHARPDMDAAALLSLCMQMIAPLQDAHVGIDAGTIAIADATSPIRERKRLLERAFAVPPWMQDRQTYTTKLQAAFNADFLSGEGRTFANDLLQVGRIGAQIGYLSIFGEFGYAREARAALDLPRHRVKAARFLARELAAAERALDEAAVHLRGVRALIIDARLNYGGYDRLALAIAGRFTDRVRTAFIKRAFTPGGLVSEQDIVIAPRAPSLAGVPIYLITSRQTASAGEILTLALSCCPNVIRVGEPTLGILSDNLYKRLPAGWELSLSNEIYTAPDGALYEGAGIPPHVSAPIFDPADVRGGFRIAVDTAVELAKAALGAP